MNTDLNYFFLVLSMGLVTYLPRMIPITFLSRREIPEVVRDFLGYIPVAVLSALLLPVVLMTDGKVNIGMSNTMLLSSIIVLPVAYKSKNMFTTVIIGMIIFVLLTKLPL